ncbi:hypothetical protein [Gelidibacter pelagius]|uniref:Uncharacterized protein n=1 Tax=Gelidibacter pelagius TaxID=2819985 RepID=A0ABS3SWS4_9FLAO|nr:hypothetical protein [Gelidibacter pelagius]MBO3099901.1 hypothetical protein [Gelidibacter pelagius]
MSINLSNIVILMTGTIKPNSFATLALKDPEVRKSQYVDAIRFYLTNTTLNIIFVENSGVELYKEFENNKDRKRLELITYKSKPTVPDKGKGAKELEIIDYAVNHSKFISESFAVIKVTGRLKVLNIIELTTKYLSQAERFKKVFSCNIYKLKKMDARCFFFTKDFFPFLREVGQTIDLQYSIEMALWDSALKYLNSDGNFRQLKHPLRIKGVNAGFGTSYEDSFISATAKRIRHCIRAPYYYQKMIKKAKSYGKIKNRNH